MKKYEMIDCLHYGHYLRLNFQKKRAYWKGNFIAVIKWEHSRRSNLYILVLLGSGHGLTYAKGLKEQIKVAEKYDNFISENKAAQKIINFISKETQKYVENGFAAHDLNTKIKKPFIKLCELSKGFKKIMTEKAIRAY